jgi:DNA polymerase-3 subunit delta'
MAFEDVLGQEPAVQTLRRALASGRIHHAYRFEGPEGVGKELCALELAKELVCGPGAANEVARQRIATFGDDEPRVPRHPDVVVVQRGLYGKLIGSSEATGISVEQIRRIVLTRAGYPPYEGRALVFIVRDADELTVSAANALLKTLEEPSAHTHFVLLTSRPRRLLDTILSRTLAVRFGPLPDAVVAGILQRNGADPHVAPLGSGSASRALQLADAELVQTRQRFVTAALDAIAAPDLTAALALAEDRPPDKADLRDNLEFLATRFADDARACVGSQPARAQQAAARHHVVLGALTELERNAQPALALETMILRLRSQ